MHRNHHLTSECTGILPLTHECTEIIIPQVNAPKSYPHHMCAPKSSLLKYKHQNPTPHTWMHQNRHPSSRCTEILTLTHARTEIVIPQVNAPESYPSHINARKRHSSGECTEILPLTHECTEIVNPEVNAPESCPSRMNAPKWSILK